MSKADNLTDFMTDLADTIREVEGTSEPINPQGFSARIRNLSTGGSGGGGMKSVTYAELKALRDNSQLIAGQQYRITDYVTTTTQENTRSAGHPFDIIVTADSENTLNENARAIQHEGNTYFANCNLNAWEIKYSLDNDKTRFYWAQESCYWITTDFGEGKVYILNKKITIDGQEFFTTTDNHILSIVAEPKTEQEVFYYDGETAVTFEEDEDTLISYGIDANSKGVIYYMKDEWNNECPYDFKNIQYKRWYIEQYDKNPDLETANTNGAYLGNKDQYGNMLPTDAVFDEENWIWCYTFTGYDAGNDKYYDVSAHPHRLSEETIQQFEDDGSGTSVVDTCKNNSIGIFDEEYFADDIYKLGRLVLSNNVFFTRFIDEGYDGECEVGSCNYNTFGNYCYSNTFGNYCNYNTFGNSCNSNTFGNYCYSNTFGNYCNYNTFGNYCYSNTFGNSCNYNTFGNSCNSNTFGNYCYSNTFGNYCNYNTFGNSCNSNTFGNSCNYNTFGNDCNSNTFGNSCNSNTFGNDCYSNTFGNDCYSNTFGNDCYSNTFGNDCYSNTFGNSC
ncbi:MAG: hypothetical protein IKW45_06730, partial [Clostridia bacterium]|nr:hypothetical protein [Clostridia bacterium]